MLYASILITEFLAPYNLHTRHVDYIYAPPQRVHCSTRASFVGPFVYGDEYKLDMETLQARLHRPTPTRSQPIRFFCRGDTTSSGA